MSKTKISWCDEVWNPVTGCTKISEGCRNCYAEKMATRLQKMKCNKYKDGFNVTCHPEELDRKFSGKGKRIFVNSMSDLFHKDVPFEFIWLTMCRIWKQPEHIFLILTKRHKRMGEFFQWVNKETHHNYTPLKNLWLGGSVSTQKDADIIIPAIAQIPAAVRFISFEPMIENVKLPDLCTREACHDWSKSPCDNDTCPSRKIDWVICGGESGNNARPLHPDWVRSLRDQCALSGVPFFLKQWGVWEPFYDRDKDDPDWENIPKEIPGKVRSMNLAGGWGFHGDRLVYFRKTKVKPMPKLDGKVWAQFPEVKP